MKKKQEGNEMGGGGRADEAGRRSFLALGGLAACGAVVARSFGGLGVVVAPRPALAQDAALRKRRLLTVFLNGGWDSALGTDPVEGAKASSGKYDSGYNSLSVSAPAGKANLRFGTGLAPAQAAFAAVPTAFVNGMYNEVTAHNIAVNYMLSGRLSLSISRQFPALAAMLGKRLGKAPAHVALGRAIPLGDTALDAPPLVAADLDLLSKMVSGPGPLGSFTPLASDLALAEEFIQKRNARYAGSLSAGARASLAPWSKAESSLAGIWAAKYGEALKTTAALQSRYGFTSNSSDEALMAGAFLSLKCGLSQYVTVSVGSFDTHQNHLSLHTPEMQRIAALLALVVEDLRSTPDPLDAPKTLMDNTTILVVSDFVRTPLFNLNGGTDHWQSASAILMGAGVRDNTVAGRTDASGLPMGWESGAPVALTESKRLLPEHLMSAVLLSLGASEEAHLLHPQPLSEVIA